MHEKKYSDKINPDNIESELSVFSLRKFPSTIFLVNLIIFLATKETLAKGLLT